MLANSCTLLVPPCPAQVYVHVSISPAVAEGAELSDQKEEVLWTTRADEGGSGQPLAFALEKGIRPPRAWEVALKCALEGTCNSVHVFS
eukprot:1143635-Pelagomonas_calceolata.AAC.3